jgi:hypothetical protein
MLAAPEKVKLINYHVARDSEHTILLGMIWRSLPGRKCRPHDAKVRSKKTYVLFVGRHFTYTNATCHLVGRQDQMGEIYLSQSTQLMY